MGISALSELGAWGPRKDKKQKVSEFDYAEQISRQADKEVLVLPWNTGYVLI